MKNFTEDQIKQFAQQLQDQYNDQTRLPEITNHEWFDPGKHRGLEFVQFARKSPFPVEIIENGLSATNARNLVYGNVAGEEHMLVESYKEKAANNEIPVQTPEELTTEVFQEAAQSLHQADTVYVPSEYTKNIYDIFSPKRMTNKDSEDHIEVPTGLLSVVWLPKDSEIDDIYVASSQDTRIIQKRMSESDIPENFSEEYIDEVPKQPLMVYIGDEIIVDEEDEDFPEKVDLAYRTVLTEPILDQVPASKIDCSEISFPGQSRRLPKKEERKK